MEHSNHTAQTGRWFRKPIVAAAMAALVLAGAGGTAYAAWKRLSAREVAQELEDKTLAEAFRAEEAWGSGEIQSCGGYDISLIGLVSGEELSDYPAWANGGAVADRTYAVVSISRTDGTPMPGTADRDYGEQDFLVSPYIEGYDPAIYNIFTLEAGGYSAIVANGAQYRVMQVETIEPFADHTIYLGVSDGTFYNRSAYRFDEATGHISRNEGYSGVNALFTLPIDPAKADGEKAAAIVRRILSGEEGGGDGKASGIAQGDGERKESEDNEGQAGFSEEVEAFMERLTPENIEEYAAPIESTRQTVTPGADGAYDFRYELPSGAGGRGTSTVGAMFPDGAIGMSRFMSYSCSDGLEDLAIETHTLNADGTVTFVVYMPL